MHYQIPDFDKLQEIAKEDPAALDRIRTAATNSLIARAAPEHRRRLRGLQFQIEMEIRRAKTPMEGCVRVSSMMHEKLQHLKLLLQGPDEDQQVMPARLRRSAKILPFR